VHVPESHLPETPPDLLSEENDSPLGMGILDWLKTQPPLLIGVVVVAIVLICITSFLILRSLGGGEESASGTPTLDPTVLSEYVLPAADTILTDNDTPQPRTDTPSSIAMKGLEFRVLPYVVQEDGEWRYPAGQSGTAVWIYGTIINYVFGLEHTEANEALLDSLVAGSPITMTTTSDRVYRFGFAGREEVASLSPDLLSQTQPGLTLVTLGGRRDTHLVVYADYLLPDEGLETGGSAGPSVSVGEPTQLGDIRLTVLETSYMYDHPDTPEGWAFFQVDYQLENLSQETLDPNRFRMELQDGAGNTYSLNLPASQAGTFGYLMLTIPPNTVAMGTAGYLVPAPLQGPKLGWSFSRLDTPERVIKVLIDFQPPAEIVDPGLLASVSLTGAELSGDRTLLTVWGTVLNNSEEELLVTLEDVTLRGRDDLMALRAADPALPWTVQSGAAFSFRLAFQRPSSPVATFQVLNQPFEISGLE
jgi:hypothetical protein